MTPPKMVFTQLTEWIPHDTFRRIVARHRGDYKVQSFSCGDPFLCRAFAQLTYRKSLRDIEVCLRSRSLNPSSPAYSTELQFRQSVILSLYVGSLNVVCGNEDH